MFRPRLLRRRRPTESRDSPSLGLATTIALGGALALVVVAGLLLLAGRVGGAGAHVSLQADHRANTASHRATRPAPPRVAGGRTIDAFGGRLGHATRSRDRAYGRLPLEFVRNDGETDERVAYFAQAPGSTLFLSRHGDAVVSVTNFKRHRRKRMVVSRSNLRMQFVGANRSVPVEANRRLPGRVNWYIGSDRRHWHRNIPTYRGVTARSLYRGIDVAYYGRAGRLEYDFRVAPHARTSQIRLRFAGVRAPRLTRGGALLVRIGPVTFRQGAPVAFQMVGGHRRAVPTRFRVGPAASVALAVGSYDHALPLVIDPTLTYSSYLGGSSNDDADAIAVDGQGEAYVAGFTASSDFPTTSAYQPTLRGARGNAFVTKLNAAGNARIFSTYLGGSTTNWGYGGCSCGESARAIAVDAAGNAYVVGGSSSSDFPTTSGVVQPACVQPPGGGGAFVAKLSSTGTLSYSTCLGGHGSEAFGVAVDGSGDAFVAGVAESTDFPTTSNAFQTQNNQTYSEDQAFVTELNPSATALLYSSYLGGSEVTQARAIAVDGSGAAYVAGLTNSTELSSVPFPIVGGIQPTLCHTDPVTFQTRCGGEHSFLAKIAPGGGSIAYSTYIGTGPSDGTAHAYAVAVDRTGDMYAAGGAYLSGLPTANAIQPQFGGGGQDGFVEELTPDGQSYVYSTYLGGTGSDGVSALAVDATGSAYLTGWSDSPNYPIIGGAQSAPGGGLDATLTAIAPGGNAVTYSTFLGGSSDDVGTGVAIDSGQHAYFAGYTGSPNYPILGPEQPQYAGGSNDAFVSKFSGFPLLPPAQTLGAAGGRHALDPSEPGGRHAPNPSGYHGEPVNTATGNFYFETTDLSLPGPGVAFKFSRSYNSLDPSQRGFGKGWTYSYAASLEILNNGWTVVFHAEDGQQLRYTKQQDGTFLGPQHASTLKAISGGYELTSRDQLRYDFDASGMLTKVTDRNSLSLVFSYGANGKLATVTDTAGRVITFSYDASNRLSQVALPDGRSVAYGYDTSNRLSSVTDARGHTTTYGYDSAGLLNDINDQNNHTLVHNVYDPTTQRVTSQADGRGKLTTFAWDPTTETATVTDPRGKVWKDVYNGVELVERIDPLGDATSYGYDAGGALTSVVDARGNETDMTYDGAGNMLTRKAPAPLSYQQAWTYNSANDPTQYTDRRGDVTKYSYDGSGNLTSLTRGYGTSSAATTTYTRDPQTGLITAVTDPRGKKTSYGYDSQGDRTSITTPQSEKTTMGYDASGRMTSLVDPRGNVQGGNPATYTTTFHYDAANDLTERDDPLGDAWKQSFDPAGNLASSTDPNNHTVNFGYNQDNDLTSVTAPDATQTLYSYDDAGNLASRTDANLHATSYGYDDAGRLTSVVSPVGTWSYVPDAAGNVATRTDPKGVVTTYGYDALNRLSTASYSDGTSSVSYSYDANGNRTQITDGQGTETFAFDPLDRLTSDTRGHDTFSFTWDLASNLASRTYPDRTATNYTYDNDERLASAAVGTASTTYGYDPASDLTTTTLPSTNGYIETRTYDPAGHLTEVKNAKGASLLSDFSYTLDGAGNPTKIVTPTKTTSYLYDSLDRLTDLCNAATCAAPGDIHYTYDPVGNRLSDARATGTTMYTYNSADELTQTSGPSGTIGYAYDLDGNETSAGTRTFGYDAEGRMKTTTQSGTTSAYAYAGDGRRLTATVGSTTTPYLWDLAGPLPELAIERSGTKTLRRYIYGARRISMNSGGSDYYYHYDPIGSVANVTSSTGALQLSYSYEPFGATTETKMGSPPTNLMRFAGEQVDTDTGLYYLRARQYDSGIGRFTGPDPAEASRSNPYASLYQYANDRPTVLSDPSGRSAIGEIQDPSHPSVFSGSPLGDLGYPTEADARRYHNQEILKCIEAPQSGGCSPSSKQCGGLDLVMPGGVSLDNCLAQSVKTPHVSPPVCDIIIRSVIEIGAHLPDERIPDTPEGGTEQACGLDEPQPNDTGLQG